MRYVRSQPRLAPSAAWRARFLVALGAVCGAGAANAGDFELGIGAGIDHGHVDCVDAFACDHSGSFWKLTGSGRVNDAVEVQAMLFGAGRFHGGDTTPLGTPFGGAFEVNGLGVTAGQRWTVAPGWSVAARAGFAGVRTRFSYADPFAGVASVSKTTLQPLAGVGVGFAVTPKVRVGVDYDITRFKVHTTHGSLQLFGIATQISF